jgi:hypothetical protein
VKKSHDNADNAAESRNPRMSCIKIMCKKTQIFSFSIMIAFQLVLLLLLLNNAESISRHRHTFFFEEDALDAFTNETTQILGKHAVRVNNFSGMREWKVMTTPEEIVKVVKAIVRLALKFK